ncbi:hypothetical protein H310_04055 [Aphanomyces invadans]|uniref:NECAP PHear domain-containing protein n=1 Tax=Aphanomyces invadans TaxID=157072 RepID=A0A024UGJ7_9STRA|nr:hypothetical protein H310_04055 [Aphanomyces invadans]ETW04982.1 hypothetical protein H310_04055 [Aphanomyces invadans]RHY33797.1 hypothetical protein DYB32_001390 [Aphanomyces invadans]|eukprot:XP_008866420.1 hypothetical protein H310_04055 [Aphanomyces invadans]
MEAVGTEQTLFHEKNVWIYKVPLLTGDPRADQWDVEKPLMTGSLRVVQINDRCFVNLYEPNQTIFAQCPVEIDSTRPLNVFVQDCIDSSRYFVLRVVDANSNRQAFVGIGLPERSAAFNFKAALQDFAKYTQRTLSLEQSESKVNPPKDLGLPSGAKLRIQIGGKAQVVVSDLTATDAKRTNSQPADLSAFKIAPPPASNLPSASSSSVSDEDWGEFK